LWHACGNFTLSVTYGNLNHHVLRLEEVPSHIGDLPVTARKIAAIKEFQFNAILSNISVL
jgi:hypothetical protein